MAYQGKKTPNAKALLLEEIASENINVLRIRELCRDNPGLIASAGLRIRIWSILLLGGVCVEDDAGLMNPYEPCGEMQVLEADVRRTRSAVDDFRSSSWRRGLTDILQVFCLTHSVLYKQGMNEIAAPFLYLNPPPKGEALSYTLFEAFILRYVENFFCKDESIYLFKAFRLFHLLLVYIDPQLAYHLEEQQFVPELYSPSWFLTMYSRGLDLPLLLRLWDMLIAVDDPAFTFFVGLALLREKRTRLLLADSCDIPEIISDMQIRGESGVDELVVSALELYRSTPRCFLRYLRVCCVHTPELAPLPPVRSFAYSGGALVPASRQTGQVGRRGVDGVSMDDDWTVYTHAMAAQSVRTCMMLSATEFISILSAAHENPPAQQLGGDASTLSETSKMVVLDVRSISEIELSGAGLLPTSIQIEPEFLSQPDALERWLDHFDSMKGLPVVIVDLPPSQASSVALWKRLLLGQGDGLSQHAVSYGSTSRQEQQGGGAGISGFWSSSAINAHQQPQDSESPFKKSELAASADDNGRHAVHLARLLLKQGFSQVSVLDGGFPALVAQLYLSKGRVEPLIISHDHDKWANFLVVSGRNNVKTDLQIARESVKRTGGESRGKQHVRNIENGSIRRAQDMSDLEVAQVALDVATRLGHGHMREILERRVTCLSQEKLSSGKKQKSSALKPPVDSPR